MVVAASLTLHLVFSKLPAFVRVALGRAKAASYMTMRDQRQRGRWERGPISCSVLMSSWSCVSKRSFTRGLLHERSDCCKSVLRLARETFLRTCRVLGIVSAVLKRVVCAERRSGRQPWSENIGWAYLRGAV